MRSKGLPFTTPITTAPLAFSTPGMILGCAAGANWPLPYGCRAIRPRRSRGCHKALALAHELTHPFSLAFALYFAAVLHQLRQEGQAAQERAEAAMTLSSEQGFELWLKGGTIYRGWVLIEQGHAEEGIGQIRQGMAGWRATGAEVFRPYNLGLLAEAYGKGGQVEEGVTTVTEALATVDKTGERWCEAELYRLKGELTLQQASMQRLGAGVQKEAEECFWKAIEIARRQQAKSLELRAAMSLSRLWQQQGKRHEAHKLLAAIYSWFTEGFDTADLKQAKALLDELST
jgi:predicted ATPase